MVIPEQIRRSLVLRSRDLWIFSAMEAAAMETEAADWSLRLRVSRSQLISSEMETAETSRRRRRRSLLSLYPFPDLGDGWLRISVDFV